MQLLNFVIIMNFIVTQHTFHDTENIQFHDFSPGVITANATEKHKSHSQKFIMCPVFFNNIANRLKYTLICQVGVNTF